MKIARFGSTTQCTSTTPRRSPSSLDRAFGWYSKRVFNSTEPTLNLANGISLPNSLSCHLRKSVLCKLALRSIVVPILCAPHDCRNIVGVAKVDCKSKPVLDRIWMEVVLNFALGRLNPPRSVFSEVYLRYRSGVATNIIVVDMNF